MEIEVKGHSGCKIDITRNGKELFIYKSSFDKNYFSRLILQAKKQEKASMSCYQHIRIPRIFGILKNPKFIRVKMEYIYSKNFIEYFESAGFEQISYFITALKLFLEKEISESKLSELDCSVLIDKFNSICNKIHSNILLKDDVVIDCMLSKSRSIFENLGPVNIPLGLCHGDLTFSNILFNGNNYYLIDFLDSFVESPLLDIVKIRQDSKFLWSQLMYIHEYDQIRLKIVSSKIDKEIDQYFSKYDWYLQYYKIFQLMNFWRILQYAKEENVIEYLKNVIKIIVDEF